MYIPPHNAPPSDDDVTVSMIPFPYEPSRPQRGALLGRLARPDGQWRDADRADRRR